LGQLIVGKTNYRNPIKIPLQLAQLSRRQNEVLYLVVQGYSNRSIAMVLGIARQTVKNHLYDAYKALGVRDRTQAAVVWVTEEMKHG
jgi:DNA-binding NarL/FixJ family response regulator